MKNHFLVGTSVLTASIIASLALPAFALADTVGPITFESPTYNVGSINGQAGWSSTGPYDQGVVASPVISGSQSFRISNAVTSGSFGDQTFAPALVTPAGETGADNASYGSGPFNPHFESEFTLEAIPNSLGDVLSVSPDRGDGARMSYLRFDNESDGIRVFFDDVTDPSHVQNAETFNERQIALLDPSVAHTIKFSMDFYDGPDNDVVDIYIDGALVTTGTSWENYYLFDTESNPGLANPHSRTVRTVLLRAGGAAVPASLGKGFLVDDLSFSSGSITVTPPAVCPVGTTQSATAVDTVTVPSNSSTPTSGTVALSNGQNYLLVSSGTWSNGGLNVADTAFASINNWLTHMQGYNIAPFYLGQNEFKLQVNGNFVNWGSYTPTHTYSSLYSGTGTPANFLVFDGDSTTASPAPNPGWYGDNSGSLAVNVYACTPVVTPPTVPTTKEQCKNDGWKTLQNGSGHSFKNQGDCVSFIATKGKNKGAGN